MPMTLAQAFKTVRGLKRMTQRALADKLGVTNVYLSYLEKGKQRPSLPLLARFEEITGFDPYILAALSKRDFALAQYQALISIAKG